LSLDDESTAGSGATLSGWQWNFGDGGTSALQNPSHTYDTTGTFTITLTVTNSSGCTNGTTFDITIMPQPVAAFSFTQIGFQVTFSNSSVTNGQESYSWNFGDGIISNAQDPIHSYAVFGIYTACVTVYDSVCAATDSECHVIDLPEGISNEINSALVMSPNPVSDVLTIAGLFSYRVENICVVDITGRKMMEYKVSPETTVFKLNLQSLPQGLYVIEMRSGNAMLSRKINVIH
jgi:PKD repeat protein